MPDHEEYLPTTQDDLAKFLTDNARRPIVPVGGSTVVYRHERTSEAAIAVRLEKLNRVIDYPARDMTITVEAGIRMSDLTNILKAENQRLPIDVPQAEQATLGGVIATNWSGPRRFGCGTMRDYVIGISAIDASGRLFKAGGRVVKNVAGYDLCKLLVGSHGTLAIITQVTLKLRPCPETSALVWMSLDSLQQIDAVLAKLLTSATRPMAIEVLNPQAVLSLNGMQGTCENNVAQASGAASALSSSTGSVTTGGLTSPRSPILSEGPCVLCIGYEGAEHETNWQAKTLVAECRPFEPRSTQTLTGPAADPLWAALTDFAIVDSLLSFKANLLPSRTMEFLQLASDAGIAAQTHAGNGIVIGHLPSDVTSAAVADTVLQPLRECARSCGGDLIMLDRPAKQSSVWMQRVKQNMDPLNLLNHSC